VVTPVIHPNFRANSGGKYRSRLFPEWLTLWNGSRTDGGFAPAPQTVLLTVARAAFPTGQTAISFGCISPSVGSLCMGISAGLL